MLEHLLQAVAISGHGSAFLIGKSDLAPLALNGLDLFRICGEPIFERVLPNGRGAVLAATPNQFVRKLKQEEVESIRFKFKPSADLYESAINSESKPYFLITDGNAGLEAWVPTWKFRGDRLDGRNWKVHYESERASLQILGPSKRIPDVCQEMLNQLKSLQGYFAEFDERTWHNRCTALIDLHCIQDPSIDRHPDLIPSKDYPKANRALLASSIRILQLGFAQPLRELVMNSQNAELKNRLQTLVRLACDGLESSLILDADHMKAAA